MVSESVSWPVSMMIGALNPFLRKMRTASRPSMSGRPTSMITRSICPALAACTALVPFSAIQAIATTAPELSPVPGLYATFAHDHEYKRQGTLSLLAGIDLLTGKVHALVKDRHRSREVIAFLNVLDGA